MGVKKYFLVLIELNTSTNNVTIDMFNLVIQRSGMDTEILESIHLQENICELINMQHKYFERFKR